MLRKINNLPKQYTIKQTKGFTPFLFVLLTTLSLFSLISCQNRETKALLNGEIQTNDTALSKISGVTSGHIPDGEPIIIEFNQIPDSLDLNVLDPDNNEITDLSTLNKSITISPKLAGHWEKKGRAFHFIPNSPIKPGKQYNAVINLAKLFTDVEISAKKKGDHFYAFSFFSAPDTMLSIGEPEAIIHRDTLDIALTVESPVKPTEKEIRKKISFSGRDKPKSIQIEEKADSVYRLIFSGFPRKKNSWSTQIAVGKQSFVQRKENFSSFKMVIPAKNFFGLHNYTFNKEDRLITFSFSENLDDQQSVEGLFSVKNKTENGIPVEEGSYSLEKKGNQVFLYFTSLPPHDFGVDISPALSSSEGKKLGENVLVRVSSSTTKPQIEFLDKKGGIVPGDGKAIVAFQTINLNAVDIEITKIYADNMVNFFQDNDDFTDANNLYRVGKVILKTKLDFNKNSFNSSQWTTHNLQLDKLIQTEPGAAYRIMLRMRPAYSAYPGANNIEEPLLGPAQDYWKINQNNYRWQDKDNPAKKSYYIFHSGKSYYQKNNNEFICLVSNIGLIAKKAGNGDLRIYATNIFTGSFEKGVSLKVFDYQEQLLAKGTTDSNGSTLFTFDSDETPFVVTASKGNNRMYLKIADGMALSTSSFDTGGVSGEEGVRGFFFGERGVWRPGDDIHLFFMVEDRENRYPSDYPILFKLDDPSGKTVHSQIVNNSTDGIYRYTVSTSDKAKSGTYHASATLGNRVITFNVPVELIKPNHLELSLKTRFKGELRKGSNTFITKGKWLHGGSAKGLRLQWESVYREAPTEFEGYSQYVFSDPTRSVSNSSPTKLFDGKLGAEGTTFSATLNPPSKSPGKLYLYSAGKIFEPGGDFSVSTERFTVSPYINYVGLSLGKGDPNSTLRLERNGSYSANVVLLNADGVPVPNRDIELSIYRIRWHWWWENSDNLTNVINRSDSRRIKTITLKTNAKGVANYKLNLNNYDWGRHIIIAKDRSGNHSAGRLFYTSWWNAGKDGNDDFGASRLEFSSDKKEYKVGDTIRLRIPTTGKGEVLVSLEAGSRLLNDIKQKSSPRETIIEFKATEEMCPTLYANITVIQPSEELTEAANRGPVRMYGIQPIKVTNPQRELHPKIVVPNRTKPQSTVDFTVSERDGNKMSYVVMVVDEGLLGLTNFKTPNPLNSFNRRESLTVLTWDMFNQLLQRRSGAYGNLYSIGGGDDFLKKNRNAATDALRDRFKPVVKTYGPFTLGSHQDKTHQFKVPSYLGKLRFMVVACHNSERFGQTEAKMEVKDDVMIFPTLPRVMTPQEDIAIPVTIWANKPLENFKFTATAQGGTITLRRPTRISANGAPLKDLTSLSKGEYQFMVPGKMNNRTGIASFTFIVTGSGSKTVKTVSVEVRPPALKAHDKNLVTISPGKSRTITSSVKGLDGSYNMGMEISNLPPLTMDKWLDYLIRYPYGCAEQATSAIMGQLNLNALTELTDAQQNEVHNNITSGLEKIKRFQTPGGGFSVWEGGATSIYVTSYVGHCLLMAKDKGYTVDDTMYKKWLNYQKSTTRRLATRNLPKDTYSYRQNSFYAAYGLYTLALANQPNIAAMNRLRQELNNTTKVDIYYLLASSYALTGKKKVADNLMKKANQLKVDGYKQDFYGSWGRKLGIALYANILIGDSQQSLRTYKKVSNRLSRQNYLSTNSLGWMLSGAAYYAEKMGSGKNLAFELNKQKIKPNEPYYTLSEKLINNKSYTIRNTGKATIFVQCTESYYPRIEDEKEQQEGLSMSVRTRPSSSPYRLNEPVIFTIGVSNKSGERLEDVMVTTVAPTGWEIINPRLDQTAPKNRAEREDIRDDRIYTQITLDPGQTKTISYKMIPTIRGKIYLPGSVAESMYSPHIFARKTGRWLKVE